MNAVLTAVALSAILIVFAAPASHVSITQPAEPVNPDSYIVKLEGVPTDSHVAKLFASMSDSKDTRKYDDDSPSHSAKRSDSSLHDVRGPSDVVSITENENLKMESESSEISREAKPAGEPVSRLSHRNDDDIGSSVQIGSGIRIYVIGTGINTKHECFDTGDPENPRAEWGETFGTFNAPMSDTIGYGTHAACMIANIAPGAKILAVKVVGTNFDEGTAEHGVDGIDWVIKNAKEFKTMRSIIYYAHVVLADHQLDQAVKKAVDAGIIFVAMAGNKNENAHNFSPARSSEAITVSAIRLGRHELVKRSNYGAAVDFLADGYKIFGAWAGGRIESKHYSGTMPAGANVTGTLAAALSLSRTKLDIWSLRLLMMNTAEEVILMVNNNPETFRVFSPSKFMERFA